MNLSCRRYAKAAAEFDMTQRLGNTVWLSWMQTDESVISGQGGIVGVDSIQGKIGRRGQMDYFRACRLKLAAKFIVLRLRVAKLWPVEESQFLPMLCTGGNVPSSGLAENTPVLAATSHHGMTVKRRAID